MPWEVTLVGAGGRAVVIGKNGQLTTAPLDYSKPVFREINVINKAFNFIEPRPSQSIVITDILLSTDKAAPAGGSIVEVYEADSATSTTSIETILIEDLPRQDKLPLVGLNWFVPEGLWVNVKSDGATGSVLATIAYYYVPKR